MKTITEMEGDLTLDGTLRTCSNVNIAGDLNLVGDLTIGGWLDAPNLKNPCRGLFISAEELAEAFPRPHDGEYAFVGTSFPAAVYAASNRSWRPTGGVSPQFVIDNHISDANFIGITADVRNLTADIAAIRDDITALRDADEQLETDLGKVETYAGNAQADATAALELLEDLDNHDCMAFADFDGFDNDDAGYSGDGTSSQPAVRVLYHTLYHHFEARVTEGGRQRTVKRWKGAEAFNRYDDDGNPTLRTGRLYRLGSRFFAPSRNGNDLNEL